MTKHKMRGYALHNRLAFIFVTVLFIGNLSFGQKGTITVGFTWGIFSRGGFTIGYYFLDNTALEAYFGGPIVLHWSNYGISLKYKPIENNDFFVLLGVENLRTISHRSQNSQGKYYLRSTSTTGIGFGCGYEVNIKNNRWKLPVEIGVFRQLRYNAYETIYDSTFTSVIGKKDIETKPLSLAPYVGVGVAWHSRAE